jgi:hypothetical protein
MIERTHYGGKPGKKCMTYLNGEIQTHGNISEAAERLGITGKSGSMIRVRLASDGLYRPRAGGVAWEADKDVPDEAKEAMTAYYNWGGR